VKQRIVTATLAVTVLGVLVAGCGAPAGVVAPATTTTAISSPAPSPAATADPTTAPVPVQVPPTAPAPAPLPAAPDRSLLTVVDPFAVTPWAVDGSGDPPADQLAHIGAIGAVTYATPGGPPLGLIPGRTLSDLTVVPVHEVSAGGAWLRVGLTSRLALPGEGPVNGATGWIHVGDVASLTLITTRVTVDLTTRTLTITEADAVTYRTEVAVGAPASPTPVGTAFLVSRWTEGSATPQIAALSFHSESLATFKDDPAVTAIHTYRGPTRGDVSHGCIRIPDPAWAQISALPLGTPIEITEE